MVCRLSWTPPELEVYVETHALTLETLGAGSATPSLSRMLAHAGASDHSVADPDAASAGRTGVQRISPVRDTP